MSKLLISPRRKGNLAVLLVATLSLHACSDAPLVAPLPPDSSPTVDARRSRLEVTYASEERFIQLARLVPGFGGYFFDAEGNVHVYLTDLSRQGDIRQELRHLIERPRKRPSRNRPRIIIHRGLFDFRQLASWRNELFRAGFRALHSIDVDEAENSVRVGVTRAGGAAVIMDLAGRLAMPRTALRIEISPPDVDLQTLSDLERPAVGGLLITSYQTGGQCTLGFNTHGGTYFVTASHCTTVRGPDGVDPTRFFQPDVQRGYYAGYESNDPPYFSSAVNSQCPSTANVCRWSDAALIRYVDGWAPGTDGQGLLARTVYYTDGFTEDGSKDIVGYLTVTGESNYPTVGLELGKIGPSSGWTAGPVIHTCVNIEAGGYEYLCQDVVQANARLGDSGGPVFELEGGYTVTFFGTVRGWSAQYGGFSFSSFWNIQQDLGYLPVIR